MHAEDEVHKDVDGGDPADVSGSVGRELVGGPVGLEEADGGDEAECAHDYEEGPGYYEPGAGTAFGKDIVVSGAGEGWVLVFEFLLASGVENAGILGWWVKSGGECCEAVGCLCHCA